MEKKNQPIIKKVLSHYDVSLILLIMFLCIFGLIIIYSTSYYSANYYYSDESKFFSKQAICFGVGLVIMILVSLVDYHVYYKPLFKIGPFTVRPLLFLWVLCLGLQLYVYFQGHESNGSSRWIPLGNFGTLQPSEITKIMVVLLTAFICTKYKKKFKNILGVMLAFFYALPHLILIALQNLSSAIIIVAIIGVTCFVMSRKRWYYFALAGGAILALIIYLNNDTGYRGGRLEIWRHPESDLGSQTMQGLYAIASGGLFGKGLGNGVLKKGYIQEAHTDMIFTVICEELGMIGAIAVIAVFLMLLLRIFKIALGATDMLGGLIVTGVFTQIAVQILLNIAVVTNAIPSTGVPLPFISYGGTSLIILMAEMGLVLNVSKFTVEEIGEE